VDVFAAVSLLSITKPNHVDALTPKFPSPGVTIVFNGYASTDHDAGYERIDCIGLSARPFVFLNGTLSRKDNMQT
jgi:hypothetical protein